MDWERQRGEPTAAYALFTKFLHSPTRRIEDFHRQHANYMSIHNVYRLSSKWRWLERAHRYDQHQHEKRAQEARARYEQLKSETNETLINAYKDAIQLLSNKVNEMSPKQLTDLCRFILEVLKDEPKFDTQPKITVHEELYEFIKKHNLIDKF